MAPSTISIAVTEFLVLIAGLSTLVRYGTDGLYTLIIGGGSSADLVNDTHSTFSTFYQAALGNEIFNKILFFGFWMIVGLGAYMIIMIISNSFGEADKVAHEMNYTHNNKTRFLEHLGIRIGVHLAVAVAILLYSGLFIKILLPFCLSNYKIAAGSLPSLSGFGYGALAIIFLSVSLHVYIVLIRLFFLRLRVFAS